MFSRMDIDDPLGEQQFVTYGLYPSQDDYWAAQFDQLQLYATYGPGVGGLEPPDEPHGVQGPRCRRHVAIQTNDGFDRHIVSNPGVVGLSFYDLLVNWLTNSAGPDTVQIQNDPRPGKLHPVLLSLIHTAPRAFRRRPVPERTGRRHACRDLTRTVRHGYTRRTSTDAGRGCESPAAPQL